MAVEGVLFDLFGTLLVYGDMEQAWKDWHAKLAMELQISASEVESACQGFFTQPIEVIPGYTVYESRLHRLCRRFDLDPSHAWIAALADSSIDVWQRYIQLDPNALFVLQQLHQRNLPLGVLSNYDHPPHVHRLLQQTSIRPWLKTVVVSGDVLLKKPDARIFALAVERLGTSPHATLFIGDHPEEDFAGAEAAGMKSYWLCREPNPPMGKQILHSLDQIFGVLE